MTPKFKTGDRVVYTPLGWHGTIESCEGPTHQRVGVFLLMGYLYKVKLDQEYEVPFMQASERFLVKESSI